MRLGSDPSRDSSGRFRIEKRCDSCGRPIHGEHVSDTEVCGTSDGPGFFLCERRRCVDGRERLTIGERRAKYTAQRAMNVEAEDREVRRREESARAKSPREMERDIDRVTTAAAAELEERRPPPSPPAPSPAQIMRDHAGAVKSMISPSTKTVVTLYDGREAQIGSDDSNRWHVVCEDHGSVSSYAKAADARRQLPHPEQWCETCREELR